MTIGNRISSNNRRKVVMDTDFGVQGAEDCSQEKIPSLDFLSSMSSELNDEWDSDNPLDEPLLGGCENPTSNKSRGIRTRRGSSKQWARRGWRKVAPPRSASESLVTSSMEPDHKNIRQEISKSESSLTVETSGEDTSECEGKTVPVPSYDMSEYIKPHTGSDHEHYAQYGTVEDKPLLLKENSSFGHWRRMSAKKKVNERQRRPRKQAAATPKTSSKRFRFIEKALHRYKEMAKEHQVVMLGTPITVSAHGQSQGKAFKRVHLDNLSKKRQHSAETTTLQDLRTHYFKTSDQNEEFDEVIQEFALLDPFQLNVENALSTLYEDEEEADDNDAIPSSSSTSTADIDEDYLQHTPKVTDFLRPNIIHSPQNDADAPSKNCIKSNHKRVDEVNQNTSEGRSCRIFNANSQEPGAPKWRSIKVGQGADDDIAVYTNSSEISDLTNEDDDSSLDHFMISSTEKSYKSLNPPGFLEGPMRTLQSKISEQRDDDPNAAADTPSMRLGRPAKRALDETREKCAGDGTGRTWRSIQLESYHDLMNGEEEDNYIISQRSDESEVHDGANGSDDNFWCNHYLDSQNARKYSSRLQKSGTDKARISTADGSESQVASLHCVTRLSI